MPYKITGCTTHSSLYTHKHTYTHTHAHANTHTILINIHLAEPIPFNSLHYSFLHFSKP